MSKPQYAILRFAKYKGPEIGNIEAHNERTKEKYASNPDVDISRSKVQFSSDRAGTKISCGGRAADQRSRLPYPVRQCSSCGSPGNCYTGVLSGKGEI